MSFWLIALTTVIYMGVASDQLVKGNVPMSVIYFGYSLANVGFLWALR